MSTHEVARIAHRCRLMEVTVRRVPPLSRRKVQGGTVRRYFSLCVLAFTAACASAHTKPAPPQTDWANLGKYGHANDSVPPPVNNEDRVVFMGNSITESWQPYFASMFPGKPYINRGISGQTTPQMLVRFRPDVIALRPRV